MEDKTFVTSIGGANNHTAGRDINITFTQVDSVPCSNPYCDSIIAVEKAEIREGLCGVCYINEENIALNNVMRKGFFKWGILAVFTLFLSSILMIINLLTRTSDSKLIPNLSFLLLILGALVLIIPGYILWKKQDKIKEEMNLYNKVDNIPEE